MPVQVRAGQLRHKVDIQQLDTSTVGTRGQPSTTWNTFADNVAANVIPLYGRELEVARQKDSDASFKVVIRYLAGVTPRMRLKHRDRFLYILSVANIEERDRRIELICGEDN